MEKHSFGKKKPGPDSDFINQREEFKWRLPETRNAARQKFSFKLHFLIVVTSLLGRVWVTGGTVVRAVVVTVVFSVE